jgi:hypothetical protein
MCNLFSTYTKSRRDLAPIVALRRIGKDLIVYDYES